MFERMCLGRRSDIPTVCLQKLSDNDSCIRIEASWLVNHLEVCLGVGAKEQSLVLIFRDTFCFHWPCFSFITNTATIILLGNTNTVRYLSFHYFFCDFYIMKVWMGRGGGGTNVSCHLKFRPFISSQLDFRPFVSCQLNDC